MKRFLSIYRPAFYSNIVYMLQNTQYLVKFYLRWLYRTEDFRYVQNRGKLKLTFVAQILLAWSWLLLAATLLAGVLVIFNVLQENIHEYWLLLGLVLILAAPVIVAHLIAIPTWLGRAFVINPLERIRANKTRKILASHKGTIIAVAGSFGKTTMKEILRAVLSEGKKVAATPANLNTSIAHFWMAEKLSGDEEVLIFEYGEYVPGDIAAFNAVIDPDIGVLTGLNEAHQRNFGSLKATAENFMSLPEHVGSENIYINAESDKLVMFTPNETNLYSHRGLGDWKVSAIHISSSGTSFTAKKGRKTIKVKSGLLGRHNIGPLLAAVVIADKIGCTKQQIEAGIASTKPFDHRMNPVKTGKDITIIDDTYNGNVDGIRVGTALLGELKAKRKVYITPGIVEVGASADRLHREIGELIAPAADVVYIMQNSAAEHIKVGLEKADFKGKLHIVEDPATFYQHIDKITKSGDVVMLQNDWGDAYA